MRTIKRMLSDLSGVSWPAQKKAKKTSKHDKKTNINTTPTATFTIQNDWTIRKCRLFVRRAKRACHA
jgi:hypothetical protein